MLNIWDTWIFCGTSYVEQYLQCVQPSRLSIQKGNKTWARERCRRENIAGAYMRESTFKTGLPKRRRQARGESMSAPATQHDCRLAGRETRQGKDQRQPSKTRYSLRLRKSHILIEFVPANVPEQLTIGYSVDNRIRTNGGWGNARIQKTMRTCSKEPRSSHYFKTHNGISDAI